MLVFVQLVAAKQVLKNEFPQIPTCKESLDEIPYRDDG